MKYNFNFYTLHHQFYMCDQFFQQDTGDSSFWTEEATESRLAVGEGILGIGVERDGEVKGELIMLGEKSRTMDFNSFDHVVEGSLSLNSGILQVLDCPNSAIQLEIEANPGEYRVRVYSINISEIFSHSESDLYRIEVWPAEFADRVVLRKYGS